MKGDELLSKKSVKRKLRKKKKQQAELIRRFCRDLTIQLIAGLVVMLIGKLIG